MIVPAPRGGIEHWLGRVGAEHLPSALRERHRIAGRATSDVERANAAPSRPFLVRELHQGRIRR